MNTAVKDASSPPPIVRWQTPRRTDQQLMHAHWDCFSGAAGDMMLAACLDAAGDDADDLLSHITDCLRRGLFPKIADRNTKASEEEFDILCQRVWRGSGSISALHVTVHSRYGTVAAAVPARVKEDDHGSRPSIHGVNHQHESHSHGHHSHEHTHHAHSHMHSLERNHDHSHSKVSTSHEPSSSSDVAMSQPHTHDHKHDSGATSNSKIANPSSVGPIRNLPTIRQMLMDAPSEYIPDWVRDRAIAAFTELAHAEASAHGAQSIDDVHFHEVGAVDSIVDTVGTLLALYHLGVDTSSCSRIPVGEGMVQTAHGLLPVPAPATLRLLVGMPLTSGPPGRTGELVTPTAAALLRILTRDSSASPPSLTNSVPPTTLHHAHRPPQFTLRRVGVGAGTKDFVQHPNIVRLWIGDDLQPASSRNETPMIETKMEQHHHPNSDGICRT